MVNRNRESTLTAAPKPRGYISLAQTFFKECCTSRPSGYPLQLSFPDGARWFRENRFWGRLPPEEFPDQPWLNYDLVRWMEARKLRRILEWGSGASTLWLAKMCRELLSVEHDPDWHGRVLAQLRSTNLSVDLRLCIQKQDYVQTAVADLMATPPDLVLVDGIWREECLQAVTGWLDTGTTILLHDSHAEQYQEILQGLSKEVVRKNHFGPCHGMKNFRGWSLLEKAPGSSR